MSYSVANRLTTNDFYPYRQGSGTCNRTAVLGAPQAVRLSYGGSRVVPLNDETALMQVRGALPHFSS